MNNSASKYWVGVVRHFLLDVLIFSIAFGFGIALRLPEIWDHALVECWSGIILGALVFASAAYVCGLYSLHSANQQFFNRFLLIGFCLLFALGPMLGVFYLNFSARIGRGVMLISTSLSYLVLLLHHVWLHRRFRNYRERVALIVTSAEDEAEALLLQDFGRHYLDLIGVVHYENYRPATTLPVLGSVGALTEITQRHKLERILCTNQSILDPKMCQRFCQLRYSGVSVMPIIGLFEEMCQCIPLPLITPEWLLTASGSPRMIYLKKLKRAFDVATATIGLCCLWPFLLAGMVWVKIFSPSGPIFYRQIRSGRFGKPFHVIKLRTMRVDAESAGAPVWASAGDARAIPGGNFLRQYRIDEIPQLWNVLRGEMSLVGPRPERPEFVALLAKEIPYFQERMLVQPGITGWAQVNYPYGASVADARRKLEFDLYYAKNMSVFLDIFILLDTVRIILRGGVKPAAGRREHYHTSDTKIFAAPPENPNPLPKERIPEPTGSQSDLQASRPALESARS